MNYHNLSTWHIIYHFFYSEFFLTSLLEFFFIKCSSNFFSIEIINNICTWNCIFNFNNNKNFFRPVWCIPFSKNIFVFRNSYVIANFKFRIFIINFFFKINICIIFNIGRFLYSYVYLYSSTISSNLLIYIFFDTEVMYL